MSGRHSLDSAAIGGFVERDLREALARYARERGETMLAVVRRAVMREIGWTDGRGGAHKRRYRRN